MNNPSEHFTGTLIGLLFIALTIPSGCKGPYYLGEFGPYGDQEAHLLIDAPPVILVHGIKGAKLVRRADPEQTLWGNTGVNVFFHTYDELAMYPTGVKEPWDDEQYYAGVDPLREVVPQGVLKGFIVGWDWLPLFEFELYGHLVEFLRKEPINLQEGRRIFLFAYDWRLDNRVATVLLADSLTNYQDEYLREQVRLTLGLNENDRSQEKERRVRACLDTRGGAEVTRDNPCLRYWRKLMARGTLDQEGNVRFTVVTHSMGGLVGRYFANGLGYKGRIHKLVMFGSPNRGVMDAIRGVIEGEHPPSFLHYLGVKFFSAASTRKVHLSFGSLFQLFPRYRKAVVDFETGGDVTEQFGLGATMITPATIKSWKQILGPLGKDLKAYNGSLDQYLKFQLESARCLHLAISDPRAVPINLMKPCNEAQRVEQIVRYLQKYHPSVKTLPPKGLPHDPPIVNLGGYCERTLSTMAVDGQKVYFLDHEYTPEEEGFFSFGGNQPDLSLVGDNRVPIKSLNFTRPSNAGDANILVCTGHMGIIKDESLKYNLLRAIFY